MELWIEITSALPGQGNEVEESIYHTKNSVQEIKEELHWKGITPVVHPERKHRWEISLPWALQPDGFHMVPLSTSLGPQQCLFSVLRTKPPGVTVDQWEGCYQSRHAGGASGFPPVLTQLSWRGLRTAAYWGGVCLGERTVKATSSPLLGPHLDKFTAALAKVNGSLFCCSLPPPDFLAFS